MTIQAFRTGSPASLDNLLPTTAEDPGAPGPGQIRVKLAASSLNYHDFAVVSGMIPAAAGRIPMSDGAGTVEAVGDGVTQFKAGDLVVSTFFPEWIDGTPPATAFRGVPGDGIDGYAREAVVTPEHWFTRAPAGYTAAEAATLTCAGLTFSAAMRSGFSQARIANVRPPRMSARCTPSIADKRGWTMRNK